MINTTDEALAELSNRGFPQIFTLIYHSQIPLALVGTCEPVRRYFELLPNLVERFPDFRDYLPLWETNLELIVSFDMKNNSYVRYTYGEDDVELLGESYQQFLSSILIELVDSGIWDELDDLSNIFNYHHTDELREFVTNADDVDFEASKQQFINSIGE